MKKSILLVALFLGASLTSSNAATSFDIVDDCAAEAWDYGTREAENYSWSNNTEYLQWYFTEQYYRDYCE
ncbi:hypothetical protein KUL118_10970 [Tenacibaculum sp. KUL118]|nr:hypothetical protein KUL118_10970 [Tenacibaculum sp. KUL118]